jgi:hypothetical protein
MISAPIVNDTTHKLNRPESKLMPPPQLRSEIKRRMRDYLDWMRKNSSLPIPDDQQILSDKYYFVFNDRYRYLNFHPNVMQQAQDMLAGYVDRYYHDAFPQIAIHDYIGHIASSQALCWNIVLPMKKHDNFGPLFEVLHLALAKEGMASGFDFGLETAEVLELNVGQDLGEDEKAATSIDLYLRTPQGKVCATEFKLTEPDFGKCKLPYDRNHKCDGNYGSPQNVETNNGFLCYLARKGRRYWHIGGQYNLLDPTRMNKPCPLDRYYQALRNLMVAKKRGQESSDKDIRGIFVLAADERNEAFWGPGSRYDGFKWYLADVRGKPVPDVFRVSIQDIVTRFSGNLSQYKEYFQVKYGFDESPKSVKESEQLYYPTRHYILGGSVR